MSQDQVSERNTVETMIFSKHRCVAKSILGAIVITASAISQVSAGGPPKLEVTLTPGAPDETGDIPFVDVRIVAEAQHAPAGSPFMHMPLVSSNVKTSAGSLQGLKVADAKGDVAVESLDDEKGKGAPFRHWLGAREITGDLSVSYRVPITNELNPLGAAPPYELRTESGGFSGLGGAFLTLPENKMDYRFSVSWDLSNIPGKSNGVSTLGVGNLTVQDASPAEELFDVFFMGGRIRHFPDPAPKKGFSSSWQGEPPFDAKALMKWTKRLYDFDIKFFRVGGEPPYAVFLRRNLINPGGGVEVGGSFVGTFGEKTDPDDFKLTLSHEMVHTFVRTLGGGEGLASSWYSEGLAVYYQRLLPWRAGLISTEEYLEDINQTAARYYTDILNDTPNAKIPDLFWADTRVRVLPYDRGALYFAALNDRIEKATENGRSLDDLVLEMMDRRAKGEAADQHVFLSLLEAELGEAGVEEFKAMLAGELVLPASDAFGSCFERTQKSLRRYELGFDSAVLIEPKRIVRGLVAGSAAALAGLQDGDIIVKPVPQDAIQGDQQATLTLLVQRGEEQLSITYLPRGETVGAYQWRRVEHPSCGGR